MELQNRGFFLHLKWERLNLQIFRISGINCPAFTRYRDREGFFLENGRSFLRKFQNQKKIKQSITASNTSNLRQFSRGKFKKGDAYSVISFPNLFGIP
ncbi:hypothetical protein AO498_14940 [Algoriphagus sanaruensis]|uniref:Uncharacterized protein n=1 Tax=Algoriphagus sanaruensis TaxID=1727163 RepID=A0A142ERJ3_9BACT|nr:hypothetical protein AO498_14940 [Algoriphagus sanaruensis]